MTLNNLTPDSFPLILLKEDVDMKKNGFLILTCIVILASCKSTDYDTLMGKANSYQWHNNMSDAKQALQLTEKAINKEPEKWDAYSLEINIYATWSHKAPDFSNNFEGVKSVYEKWISNGHKLDTFQKFGYANTLYCLDDVKNANKLYSEIIKFYKDNEINFENNEREYVVYMLSNIILYDLMRTILKQ